MAFLGHIPVLHQECISLLAHDHVGEYPLFVDLTFGGGGHTQSILNQIKNSKVLAFDQDPDAIANGRELIKKNNFEDRLILVHSNYENFPAYMETQFKNAFPGIIAPSGILMDIGVSSHQFDQIDRGFSFRADAPLDMRMDPTNNKLLTAKEILNTFDLESLVEIFGELGEERYSKRIAEKIIEERVNRPLETTLDLENIVFHCYPKKDRFSKIHPATRCFQGLRIYVNRELEVLKNTLPKLPSLLIEGGRLLVISFHSLEDRIIKHTFKELVLSDDNYQLISKKPIRPTDEEISKNSRSRSAKLRVIERTIGGCDGNSKKKSKGKRNKYPRES